MKLNGLRISGGIVLAGLSLLGCGRQDGGSFVGDSQPADEGMDAVYEEYFTEPEFPSGFHIKAGPRHEERVRVNNIGRLADVFNDSNKYQYAYAERIGIRPIESVGDAYYVSKPVVEISSNKFYVVDELTHSAPYLVPEAAILLRTIGRDFIDTLGHRGADGYRIIVTSLLRTPQSVKSLRRVNVNATDSSTHKFGTTFDISYTRFACADSTRTINDGDLKNVLAEVLLALRKQNRCMVKFERKTGCFHITVTR